MMEEELIMKDAVWLTTPTILDEKVIIPALGVAGNVLLGSKIHPSCLGIERMGE